MARPDLDNYVPVNERVMQFRDKHPEGALVTLREPDLILNDGDVVFVRFKALAFRSKEEIELYGKTGIASATGHSELELGKDKVTEKCESIAIGRALATLGFSADKSMASQEEMQEFQEHEDRKASGNKSSRFSKREEVESEDDDNGPSREKLKKAMGKDKPKAQPQQDDDDDAAPVRGSFRDRKKAEPANDENDDDDTETKAPPSRRSGFSAARGK